MAKIEQFSQYISYLRSNLSSFLILLSMIILASCGPTNEGFLRNGIGPDLAINQQNAASARAKQHTYFNYLCEEAGLNYAASSTNKQQCLAAKTGKNLWSPIVKQGLNDIDRRCDAYLAWLDDKRRSREPIKRQLTTSNTAAIAIVGETVPNPTKAITIISQAFQLISDSIDNYHSRLLLEVENSTVAAIVFRERQKFRIDNSNVISKADNKPDAEHYLRRYLQICMPFSIEAAINSNAKLAALGIDDIEDRSLHTGKALHEAIPKSGGDDFDDGDDGERDNTFLDNSVDLSEYEKEELAKLKDAEFRRQLQRSLCVTPEDGIFGVDTRAAITGAKSGLKHSQSEFGVDFGEVTGNFTSSAETRFFQRDAICLAGIYGYKNAFEKYAYPSRAPDRMKDIHKSLLACYEAQKGQAYANATALADSEKFTDNSRALIKEVRTILRTNDGIKDKIETEITDEMSNSLHEELPNCLFV